MSRRTPIATRTATLLPSTTLVRSARVDGTLVAATRGGGSLSARVEASFGIDGLGARSRADAMPLLPLSRQGADASFRKLAVEARSEERRVGKECVSTCRSRWSPYH